MNRKGEARCGTPSSYRRHQDIGEKPCDACALAKKEYDKRWRAASGRTVKNRLHARAQGRATTLLVQRHPAEYQIYYQQALSEVYREAEQDAAS